MIVLRTYSNSKRRAETKLNKTLGQMSYSPFNRKTLEEIANDTPKGKAIVKDIENVYDMNVQVNAIRWLNEMIDKGILSI